MRSLQFCSDNLHTVDVLFANGMTGAPEVSCEKDICHGSRSHPMYTFSIGTITRHALSPEEHWLLQSTQMSTQNLQTHLGHNCFLNQFGSPCYNARAWSFFACWETMKHSSFPLNVPKSGEESPNWLQSDWDRVPSKGLTFRCVWWYGAQIVPCHARHLFESAERNL